MFQKIFLNEDDKPAEINALENVIALCPSCHAKYDKEQEPKPN